MQWHMPIGYSVVNGSIMVNEETGRLVEQIFRDYDNGISTSRIAADLTARGVRNANDRISWTHVSIGKILENQNYLGTEYYPQLIDAELFDRVQSRREQKRADLGRGAHRPGGDERNLFGGRLECAECGAVYRRRQPPDKSVPGAVAKWGCKNYIYQSRLGCTGGFITDAQAKEVCRCAINRIIENRALIKRTPQEKECCTARFRELDRIIGQRDGMEDAVTTEEWMRLIYERAQERYKTLAVKDTDLQTQEMLKGLDGVELQEDFNEKLYQGLIEKIVVYKDGTAVVVFKNKSSVKIGYGRQDGTTGRAQNYNKSNGLSGYGGQTAQEGAGNGSDSSEEKGIHDTCQAAV